MVSTWAASPVYSTEQSLVPSRLPARVQLLKSKLPPRLSLLKSTEPDGSDAVPPSVSVTVTVQVLASAIATGLSHDTLVEVDRSVTAIVSVPLLEAWIALDASL